MDTRIDVRSLDVQAIAERHRDRLERWAKSVPADIRQFRVQNAQAKEAEIWLYDEIGFDWWTGGGTTAKDFVDILQGITAKEIILHINSPGGDVFEAIAIYNALKAHPAFVTARIEGMAASAASFIAMAGDKVVMASHAMMMIHEPFSIVLGSADDLRKEADVLDTIADNLAGIYAEQGGSRTNWRQKMREETWFTDQQAVDAGLADEIDTGKAASKNRFDLSVFDHPPEALLKAQTVEDLVHSSAPVQHITINNNYGASIADAPIIDVTGAPDDDIDPAAISQEASEPTEEESHGISIASARLLIDLAEAEVLAIR